MTSLAGVAAVLAATPANAAFTVNVTFGTSGSSPAFTQAQKDTINSAVALYTSTFTDNVTVNITVNNNTGNGVLGQSSTPFGTVSYTNLHNALIADGSTADDTAALAKLASTPFTGSTNVDVNEANLKALGFNTSGFGSQPDGTIDLGGDITFTGHANPVAGKYDLYAVFCHEFDEVLGTVSGVGFTNAATADLYRFDASHNRSFTTSTGVHTFFSVDGTTNLVEYNQFNHQPGDWGDWVVNSPAQVQDFEGTPGIVVNGPNNELRLLDVVGWNRVVTPEPASMAALGLGVLALIRRRRKNSK